MTPRLRRIRSACGLTVAVVVMLAADVAPVLAAPSPEQRAVCTGDVFRLCGAEPPRVDQIIACLKRARPSLSPPCRAAVDAKG